MKKRNKMNLRNILLSLLMLFMIFTIGQARIEASPIVVKIGQTNPADHPIGIGLSHFEKRVEELTNGEIDVRVFNDSALGGDRDLIEGVQLGNIEMACSTCGVMETFAEEFDIFGIPFLFRDYYHIRDATARGTNLRTELTKALDRIGLVDVGLSTSGFRNIFSRIPVEGIEDIKGKKIRVMEVPTIIETFKVLGAIPTPVASAEVYMALQTGMVDMAESSLIGWISHKRIEVSRYAARINYLDSGRVYYANKKFMEELTEKHRKIIELVMDETINVIFTGYVVQEDEVDEAALTYNAVISNPDLEPFIQALQPIYEEFEPTLGLEMIKEIQDM